MTDQALTLTITVDQTPAEAFAAVTDVRGWWSEDIEGRTDEAGAEFTYRNEEVHICRSRVTEVVPGKRVSWHVLDNFFEFTKDQTEWTDTTIHFDIAEKDGKTEVRFTHQGLLPAFECFDVCTDAWGFYINESLRGLITTGQGQPNRLGVRLSPGEKPAEMER